MVAPWGNLSLTPLGTWLFPWEQFKHFFTLGICFHPFRLWMKKIIQKKIQTHDLWVIRGIITMH
jgi:hypothetical protein